MLWISGKVLPGDPVVIAEASIVDEKNLTTRDPAKLAEPGEDVAPVMHGERGESGAKGTIRKGKSLRYATHDRCRAKRTLTRHDLSWFESHDRSIRGLVITCSGPDVEHRTGIAEGTDDPRV